MSYCQRHMHGIIIIDPVHHDDHVVWIRIYKLLPATLNFSKMDLQSLIGGMHAPVQSLDLSRGGGSNADITVNCPNIEYI